MRIAGIDLSTKTIAVSFLNGDDASTFEVAAKGRRSADRFRDLVQNFRSAMNQVDTDIVFIEDISFVRNRQTELDLAQVLGAVKAHLYEMGRMLHTFNNQTIKAHFNLARSSKQDIVEFVELATSLSGLTEDQADAFLVAMYGRALVEAGKVTTS